MQLSPVQKATGRERFLDAHPEVKAKVLSVPQSVADALGVELAQIHENDTFTHIAQMAQQAGEDAVDYFLRYALDSEQERQQWIHARKEAEKRALGLVWDDETEQ